MKKKWLWAGIDLGVETASVCIIDDAGDVLHEAICPSATANVRQELCKFRRTRFASVAFESGVGAHVARGLSSQGYPVEVYEARQLSRFLQIRRHKTDAGDARGIAEAGRIGASLVSKVYLKSLESQHLQSRLAVRRHLIGQRVATFNLLGRQIELYGGRLRCGAKRDGLRRAAEAQIRNVFPDRTSSAAAQLRYLLDHGERLVAYQHAIDRELTQVAREIDICRRFMEIPGVGPICALTFYAAVDDPSRFKRASDVGCYLGLTPRLRESGLTSGRPRISKMGNKSARTLLVHAARLYLTYEKRESALRDWALAIEQRRGRGPSRVALARKLAVIMLALWKGGGHFNPLDRIPLNRTRGEHPPGS